jgi:selenocysteine lyase/cysteine desulfurase
VRAIEARNRLLSDYLKQELAQVRGVRLVSPRSAEVTSPGITMFDCPGRRAEAVERQLLRTYRIHVDNHVRDGHDALRVSTHFYNTRTEIDRLVEALRGLARAA